MNYKEYGKQNRDVMILLHGGGLSYWNYRDAANTLQNQFHIIIPILDGHSGSDRRFTTIEDNAKELISFIDEKFDGSVLFMSGLSLGGQILLEILSQRRNICEYVIIESALVHPSKFTYHLIKPVFGSCYGLIHHKWFSKLQFKSLHIKQELFDDYYQDSCSIEKEDMIAFLQANSLYSIKKSLRDCTAKVKICIGERENVAIKKSAQIIHEHLKNSVLIIKRNMNHGEFSINHANAYVEEILTFIQE